MVAQGRVENGVIILAEGVRLPEGQAVTILVASPETAPGHGILDITPVSVGSVLRPPTADDDLLAEMLDGRS